jgi:small subunit ribosomal protein S1
MGQIFILGLFPDTLWKQVGGLMPSDLFIGQRIAGRVIKIMPFGAFVEIENTTLVGLVKIPEISWQPIKHIEDILAIGQVIETEILAMNLENRQISLSLKRCQPNP